MEYRVDCGDVLVSVDPDWLAFAVENEAPELDAAHVLGRSLWDFVHDGSIRLIYDLILTRVRAGSTLTIPFRCDSPDLRRYMTLTMSPLAASGVCFESTLLRTEPFPAPAPVTVVPVGLDDEPPLVCVCSWCKRVRAGGEWLSVEAAVAVLGLFETATGPRLTHGMCERCVVDVMAVMA